MQSVFLCSCLYLTLNRRQSTLGFGEKSLLLCSQIQREIQIGLPTDKEGQGCTPSRQIFLLTCTTAPNFCQAMGTVPNLPKPKEDEGRTAPSAVTPHYMGGDINRYLLLESLGGSIRVIPSWCFEKIHSCLWPGMLLETGLGYNDREWFLRFTPEQPGQCKFAEDKGRIRGVP